MSDLLFPTTEDDVLKILKAKHTCDLFVAHCKVGASWYGGSLILDAWVMPYSWTRPIVGYEVKISRGDFRRDGKWRNYLQYCNLFYFVTPWGLIQPAEVPEDAGLIWVTKTGAGIRYKKTAPSRWWHQIPQGIFQYVLMWRKEAAIAKQAPITGLAE
ncbi:MAG TPA: MmcB family DNA repair protein [Candidatus Paceibacterota bacterium]|nr:MmcB family DNA repair protein [Candidatus Paceibacterota bacterium]